jgi:hypothetical protein
MKPKKGALPTIPVLLEEHPELLHMEAQQQRIAAAAAATRRELDSAEAELVKTHAACADAHVAAVLDESTGSDDVAVCTRRASELESRIKAIKERLAAEEAGAISFESKRRAVKVRLRTELEEAARGVHGELLEQLARRFQEMQPLMTALRELQLKHPSAFAADRIPQFWPDLLAALPNSKMNAWLREVRAAGVDASF